MPFWKTCAIGVVSRMPVYDAVVRRLIWELEQVFSDESARPMWMRVCTDDALRKAATYDPAAGKGVLSETDWGNNAGSVLFLYAALKLDFRLFPDDSSMLHRQAGFATSGKGACNRRTN